MTQQKKTKDFYCVSRSDVRNCDCARELIQWPNIENMKTDLTKKFVLTEKQTARAHAEFVKIHPLVEGVQIGGRTYWELRSTLNHAYMAWFNREPKNCIHYLKQAQLMEIQTKTEIVDLMARVLLTFWRTPKA